MPAHKALTPVRVKGSHRQIGQQLGEATAPAVAAALDRYRRLFEVAAAELPLTWEEAKAQAQKYLPFARESAQPYVDELEGLAEGAGVDFGDLLILNCVEGVTEDALHLGCTSLAVSPENSASRHTLVGHNEDWLPGDEANLCLIHAAPDGAPPFLAIAYGGQLPNVGFNARGIAQCCDSVHTHDVQIGVPRVFVARGTLAACNLYEAIRNVLMPRREAGYHHLIADQSGELYVIETSARHFATIYGIDGRLAHTNNYLTRRMKPYERSTEQLIGSRVRVNRATRLLRLHAPHSVDSFKSILSDHVNRPYSICSHVVDLDNEFDRQKTIASVIMDLTALEMHVCWGSPCQGEYQAYRLDA